MVLLLFLASVAFASPPYADELIARARAQNVGVERAWRTLLHYKGKESQADGMNFFLSPQGKTDAQAEVEADLAAFFVTPGPEDLEPEAVPAADRAPNWSPKQAAQCRFPARYHWLKERLAVDPAKLPDQPCVRFDTWRAALDAESVSLVFADAFLNNPASMYGHTFLRLRRRGGKESLLDYTINFAGNPDTDNSIIYSIKGLTGGFPGTYTTVPYYMKIQEYNNIESRDLWEYDLALSSDSVAQLVRHAWEMGATYFDYYFFSENCSYQLLTLLDGADSTLHLSDKFGFGTIPADTVRAAFRRRTLVRAKKYRPSHVREMVSVRSQVRPDELSYTDRVGRLDLSVLPLIASLPADRQAVVLDAGYNYLRYREGFQDVTKPESAAAERQFLIARGKLGLPPTPPAVPEPLALEDGHETLRVGVGGGFSTHGGFTELSFRPALHDLVADARGYAPGSQLEMGATTLRFDQRAQKPYIERFALVDIASLTPLDRWVKKPSWRVSAGVEQAKELGRAPADSMVVDLSPGFGVSAAPDAPGRPLFYTFVEGAADVGRDLPRAWRLGAGVSGGLLLRPYSWWRLLAEVSYRDYLQKSPHAERAKLSSSWTLWKDGELRLTLDRRTPDSEAGAALLLYF